MPAGDYIRRVMASGILLGFGAALMASLSYLFTRLFMMKVRSSMGLLFAISSVQMGMLSLALLPLVWDAPLPAWRVWLRWGVGCSGFFLIGQMALLRTLKRADSSQVAPLLGLKVAMLALISAFLLDRPLTPGGWGAVGLCTLAGLLVAPPSGLGDRETLLLVLLACLGYSGSDLCIPELVRVLQDSSRHPALLAVCISYLLTGMVGAAMLVRQPERGQWRVHLLSLPYTLAWWLGMMALYACFSDIGVIYGTILQSTRGFLNVVLGVLVVRVGWQHLDGMRGWRTVTRRAGGALLMTAAIVLYHFTKAETAEKGLPAVTPPPALNPAAR